MEEIAVIVAMFYGILFSLYGNCQDKIQALVFENKHLHEQNRLYSTLNIY